MFDLGELIPIVAIIASAWVTITLVRYKHDARRDRQSAQSSEGSSANLRLTDENERLRATVERLEDRIAVLERIATDPAERTAREIERLRLGSD